MIKKFDQFNENTDLLENKYIAYLDGVFNHIKQEYGEGISIKRRGIYSPSGEVIAYIEMILNFSLRGITDEKLRSFEYLDELRQADRKIKKLIEILAKIDLDCTIHDTGGMIYIEIEEIFEEYFEEHKEFLNSLVAINKFKL